MEVCCLFPKNHNPDFCYNLCVFQMVGLGEDRNLWKGLGWIFPNGMFPAVASSLLVQFHLDPISCLSFFLSHLVASLGSYLGTGESHRSEQDKFGALSSTGDGMFILLLGIFCHRWVFCFPRMKLLDLQDTVIPTPLSGWNTKKKKCLQCVLIKIFLKINGLVLLILVFPMVAGSLSQILFWSLSHDLSLSQDLWPWAGAIPFIPYEIMRWEHWDGLCWILRPEGRS